MDSWIWLYTASAADSLALDLLFSSDPSPTITCEVLASVTVTENWKAGECVTTE